jgi:hypothetical protein
MGDALSNRGTSPTAIYIPVYRGAAVIGGLWRLLVAGGFAALLIVWQPDWRLMWLTDKASCLAWGFCWLLLAAGLLGTLWSAGRWLLLAVWPPPLGAWFEASGVRLRYGPFGTRDFAWSELRIDFDLAVEPDLLAALPVEALMPRITCVVTDEDVTAGVLRFSHLEADALSRRIAPYLEAARASVSATSE